MPEIIVREEPELMYIYEPGVVTVKGQVKFDKDGVAWIPLVALYGISQRTGVNYGSCQKLVKRLMKRMSRMGDLYMYPLLSVNEEKDPSKKTQMKKSDLAATIDELRFEEIDGGLLAFGKIKTLDMTMGHFLRMHLKNPHSKVEMSLFTTASKVSGMNEVERIINVAFQLVK